MEALSHSLGAVKTSGAGWFPVQLVGKLDLNLSECVGNGYFDYQDFLSAGSPWKGRRWPCQPPGNDESVWWVLLADQSQEILGQLGQYLCPVQATGRALLLVSIDWHQDMVSGSLPSPGTAQSPDGFSATCFRTSALNYFPF